MDVDELIEKFGNKTWQEQIGLLLELAVNAQLERKFKIPKYQVRGCTARVWLVSELVDNKLKFNADSDSQVIKGLLAILLIIYSDKTPEQIKQINIHEIFEKMGLKSHLNISRRNGFFATVEKITFYAKQLN